MAPESSGLPAIARPARGEEAAVYLDRARRLGLPFAETVNLSRWGEIDADRSTVVSGRIAAPLNGRGAFIAPEEHALVPLAHWIARYPDIANRLRVSTPTAIRQGLMRSGGKRFVLTATTRLARLRPEFSAQRLVTGAQLAALAFLAVLAAAALSLWPVPTMIAINLIGSFFFFGVTVLRFVAARLVLRRNMEAFVARRNTDDSLPAYTVLVPLYKEANLVPALIAALDRIDWPADRLDIKIVVEADDPETIEAVEAAVDGPPYEIVVVPPAQPRTKPKALAFALTFARGDLVTIYDAEDRPHPLQLREAYEAFCRAPADVACLQAPIIVENEHAGILAKLFAIEYSALFDGLLPGLVALRLPIPLGGTSNHFRRDVLEEVGGWDPYNVTEDADLGIRLARFGYRSATLTLPTYEEAPDSLGPWLTQRTRWFKGWLQTWLVHMRRPLRFIREVGLRQFLGFNIVGTGMIVSVIVHPIYLATVFVLATDPLLLWGNGGLFASLVIGLNLFNLCAGYMAMATLAKRTLALRGRTEAEPALILLPIYWLLMSLAGYRAIVELIRRPHHWEKTPHRGQSPPAALVEPPAGVSTTVETYN